MPASPKKAKVPSQGTMVRCIEPGDPNDGLAIELTANGAGCLRVAPVTDTTHPAYVTPATGATWDMAHGRVARSVHFASAALPASGAYTSQAAYTIPADVQVVTFWITYTKGQSGGYPKAKILLGNGTEEAALITIDPTLTVANEAALQPAYVGEIALVALLDGSSAKTAIKVRVDGGETTVRCLLAEVGDVNNPGTAAIAITAGK
jgi:hypothetical protein